MNQFLFRVGVLLSRYFQPTYNARLRFLEAQIHMLRARIDGNRIVPGPAEKRELLRWGALLNHNIADVLHVVQARAYRHWLRETRGDNVFKVSGRPPLPTFLRNLVIRLARENTPWGYRRIVGELRKLGRSVSAGTVRTILLNAGMNRGPFGRSRVPVLPWRTFIHANLDSIVACDFFTKRILTVRGMVTAYVFVFIHLGSRRVYCSPATLAPNHPWVVQQARNAGMWLEDMGVQPRFILRDRDSGYAQCFGEYWKSEGVKELRCPVRAPQANAFAECFIGTLKRECLNHFVCFDIRQLDYILRTWIAHYNAERPHRGEGMNNNVLDPDFTPQAYGPVRCTRKLGGLINSYYRDAA